MSALSADTNGGRLYGGPAAVIAFPALRSPEDVRAQTFTVLSRKGGYHPDEVKNVLHQVANALDDAERRVASALESRDIKARLAAQLADELKLAYGELDAADKILEDQKREPVEGLSVLTRAQQVADDTIHKSYVEARETVRRAQGEAKDVLREAIASGERILIEAEQKAHAIAEDAARAAEEEYDRNHAEAERVAADRDRAADVARLNSLSTSMDAIERIMSATLDNYRAQTAVVKLQMQEMAGATVAAALPRGSM